MRIQSKLLVLKMFVAIVALVSTLSNVQAEEMREVQVVTEGDRSLALEWAIPLKSDGDVYLDAITYDKQGYVYCSGSYKKNLIFPDGTKIGSGNPYQNAFFSKFSPEGTLVWVKYITSARGGSSNVQKMKLADNDEIMACVKMSWHEIGSPSFYYDGEEVFSFDEVENNEGVYIVVKLGASKGDFIKSV